MKISFKIPLHWFGAARRYVAAHKFISAVLAAVLIGALWWAYGALTSTGGQTRYILGTVATGTVVASLSESGQVAAGNTLSIAPQVSGQILRIAVKPGDRVAAGALIAEIDPTEAEKAVRDAQANLQSAQLSLQKLQEPSTALSLAQAQNAVTSAQSALGTAYSGSTADLANTFLDLPSIMTGLQDINFSSETNKSQQWNIDWYENGIANYDQRNAQGYRDAAYAAYNAAKASYDATFADYQRVTVATAGTSTIEKLLGEAYNTLELGIDAVKASNALIQFYSDKLTEQNIAVPTIASTQITSLASYTSKLSSHASTLFADTSGINGDKQNLQEKNLSLAQLQQGADSLDIQSSQLSVTKAQNALTDAQATLAKYYVRAPFAGTIASVPASAYAEAGSGTTLATLITAQQYADLSINEVDAAKLKLGQRATLSFDAIPDLTLTGSVAEIDQAGTVSQGVVSYSVKIGFDAQDPRVKPGMTVNAGIITATALDALMVPQSALKTQGGQNYVQVFDPPIDEAAVAAAGAQGVVSATPPTLVPVTVGISDASNVQILSGVGAGRQIVVRTATGAAKTTTATASRSAGPGGAGIRL